MRTINETFENSEFEKLMKVKERSGKNWHDLIMTLTEKDERRRNKNNAFRRERH